MIDISPFHTHYDEEYPTCHSSLTSTFALHLAFRRTITALNRGGGGRNANGGEVQKSETVGICVEATWAQCR